MRLEEEGEVEFHCDSCISFLKANIQQLTHEHVTGASIFLFPFNKNTRYMESLLLMAFSLIFLTIRNIL